MASFAVGIGSVVEIYILPGCGVMAAQAFAGPVTGGRSVAGSAIQVTGVVKADFHPTGGGVAIGALA